MSQPLPKTLEPERVAKTLDLTELPKDFTRNLAAQTEHITEKQQQLCLETMEYINKFQEERNEILKTGIEKVSISLERQANILKETTDDLKQTATPEIMRQFNLTPTSAQ